MNEGKKYRRLIGSLAALSFGLAVAAGAMLLTRSGPGDVGPVGTAGRSFVWAAPSSGELPPVSFVDSAGRSRTLAEFKGKVVLLNFWATWCPPCVAEMPALERLQKALGGRDFEVIAVSEDRGGAGVVAPFLEKLGIQGLSGYFDSNGAMVAALATVGLPTTLLIDRGGREIGRMLGGAEWDTGAMRSFIENSIAARQ